MEESAREDALEVEEKAYPSSPEAAEEVARARDVNTAAHAGPLT
jgi:hypothetical protein